MTLKFPVLKNLYGKIGDPKKSIVDRCCDNFEVWDFNRFWPTPQRQPAEEQRATHMGCWFPKIGGTFIFHGFGVQGYSTGFCFQVYLDVSKNSGTPKWMVKG